MGDVGSEYQPPSVPVEQMIRTAAERAKGARKPLTRSDLSAKVSPPTNTPGELKGRTFTTRGAGPVGTSGRPKYTP